MTAALDGAAVKSSRRGLAFRQWGRGPSLVLLHGGVGSWTHWVRNIETLAAHFTVHALDLPGFGESRDVAGDVTPDAYLDWVAAAVKDVAAQYEDGKAGKLGIVGFSFGGVVAAAVAARIGPAAHQLTLIGPGGFGEPVGRDLPLRKRPTDKSDVQLLREVTAFNLGQWMLNTPPAVDDPVIDLHLANLDRARYDGRLIGWRATLLPDLQRMSCPTQILWGDEDRLAHPSVQVRRTLCLAARPDLETAVIPDCGHWSQYASPQVINARLLAFHAPNTNRQAARHEL
jgi:2-hydroxy-6-oxonona-2,4-dienedioate hydrolase